MVASLQVLQLQLFAAWIPNDHENRDLSEIDTREIYLKYQIRGFNLFMRCLYVQRVI